MTEVATAESVESVVADGLAEIGAERDEITREATLEALDIDSLDLVEMAQIVEDEFRRQPAGRRRQGRQDRRRVDRPGGGARLMGSPVVITGRGAVTPLGVGVEPLLERWIAGESGVVDGEAPCADFEPTDFMTRKETRRTDRFTQLALAAAELALTDAGWSADPPIDPGRVGCVIGTGIGGLGSLEDPEGRAPRSGSRAVSPLSVPLMMGNAAAAAVAMRHGLRGPSYGVVSACAAGVACDRDGRPADPLRRGRDRRHRRGGGDADAAGPGVVRGDGRALATRDLTALRCRARRLRDGGGRRRDRARVRGRRPRAGRPRPRPGAAAAPRPPTPSTSPLPSPEAKQASRAILLALEDAGVGVDDVDYVNAHGTSTELNDRSETEALKAALGDRARQIPISSTKSSIGHLLGAAGAVEAIATVGALQRGVAPPTVNLQTPGEGLDLDYVPGAAKPLPGDAEGRVAISNSFGFGGHNAVLCLSA